MEATTLLLDMGGVVLDVRNSQGLPQGRLDWRGRQALLELMRHGGAHLRLRDLETRLFAPWAEEYRLRYARGQEASWSPHLKRLRRGTGVRFRDLQLLGAWFGPYAEQVRPMPGVREALAELGHRGLRLALVSNVPLPGALYRAILDRYGLGGFFESVHFSYDDGHRKPSPAMLRAALADLDEPPSRALMVGDRKSSDVAAGIAAGVRTVWVRSEHTEGPQPDFEVGSLADLPALLDGRRYNRGR